MKIGLSYTGSPEKHERYKKWLEGKDAIQVIRLSAEEDNAAELESCDGLVLSGGVDIHPDYYNGSLDYIGKPDKWQKERDEFEKKLLEKALDKNIPVLGICRGLQLINVAMGGTLVQDLDTGNETHKRDKNDKRHKIRVEKETLLSGIAKEESAEVNSAHHQAIGELAEDLQINSRAEDGTVEGIEWKDKEGKPFLLAVQWHPERMEDAGLGDSPLPGRIRERFIEEITKNLHAHK